MSYFTRLEVEWDDSAEKKVVDMDRIVQAAADYVAQRGWNTDVLEDLRKALEGPHHDGIGFNKMYSEYIEDLLLAISRAFPNTTFLARGAGEELLDVWIREVKNGAVAGSQGPFKTL